VRNELLLPWLIRHVARTAADEHALTEISGLTDQAAAAAQAVRESMRQVGLAAAALALSEPATG
jgi:hypothetical protein